MTKHLFEELVEFGALALENENLRNIAKEAKSPNAAYNQALGEKFNEKQAKSCRFLAIIKRDHQKNFEMIVKMKETTSKWQFPITMALCAAIMIKHSRDDFNEEFSRISKERKKLPRELQPCDAGHWNRESQRIGTPIESLTHCFQELIKHYNLEKVQSIFKKIKSEYNQTEGFGQSVPDVITEKKVNELLKIEDPLALETFLRFVINEFNETIVSNAWEQVTTDKKEK